MRKSIGFIEYRSVAKGVEATDAMLKHGNVQLIQSTVLCPGKYISMISGDVGAVQSAVRVGEELDAPTFLDSFVIPNVHEKVFPALTATSQVTLHDSLGIIETADASTAVLAADAAAKAANVDLLEVRLARGLGGKGFIYLCGELTAVETAVKQGSMISGERGMLIATSVIASPHPELQY